MIPTEAASPTPIERDASAEAEKARVVEKRRRRWGCVLYAGLAILIPTLVLFCAWLWFHLADRRLAEEALASARAAGDPLTTAEMQALVYPPSPAIDEATGHWLRAIELTLEAKKKIVAERLPYVGAYGVKAELDANGFYAESTSKLVDEFLEGAGEEAIQAAHEARRAGSVARFASDVPTDELTIDDVEAPYFLREVSYLLILDTERAAARGDFETATENVLSMASVAEAFADDPTANGMDLHVALFGMSYYQAKRLIERVELSDEQLRRVDAAFAQPDFRRGLIRILQADQYRVVRGYETNEEVEDEYLQIARWLPLQGADEARTIELFQELLDAGKDDLSVAWQAKLRLESRIEQFPQMTEYELLRYSLAIDQAYEVDRYVNCAASASAEQTLLRSGIACERYRLKHGIWPESLEALVPEFLDEVPIDVFDSQAIRFEAHGDRLALHSVGQFESWNGTREFDDGPLTFVIEKPQRP